REQGLKAALATYTASGGKGRTALDQDEAGAGLLEKYEVCCALFHGFDDLKWTSGSAQERLSLLPAAQEHILQQENGKERCITAVREKATQTVLEQAALLSADCVVDSPRAKQWPLRHGLDVASSLDIGTPMDSKEAIRQVRE